MTENRLVIPTKTSRVTVLGDRVVKYYEAKYYDQRWRCGSPGEPQLLAGFDHPCCVTMRYCKIDPEATTDNIAVAESFREYDEWAVFERLMFPVSDTRQMKACGLLDTFARWCDDFIDDYHNFPFWFRDIQAGHIWWSSDTFKLIDFAIALPKSEIADHNNAHWDDCEQLIRVLDEVTE